MSVVYVAEAIASGYGRSGHVETVDGRLIVDLAAPISMRGTGAGSNPEQLVAMGVASSFLHALQATAEQHKIELQNPEVTCRLGLRELDDTYSIFFEIITSTPGLNLRQAKRLTAAAARRCPYVRAFKKGVLVGLLSTV